MRIIK